MTKAPLRLALHNGQLGGDCLVRARTASHSLKHAAWTSWLHGSPITTSPGSISLRQIAHSSTSGSAWQSSESPESVALALVLSP